jgi:hypothetical protein
LNLYEANNFGFFQSSEGGTSQALPDIDAPAKSNKNVVKVALSERPPLSPGDGTCGLLVTIRQILH